MQATRRISLIAGHILPTQRDTPSTSLEASYAASSSLDTKSEVEYKYNTLLVEILGSKVAVVTFNRPSQLNALCYELSKELQDVFIRLDQDKRVHCIVLTGNQKAFAAGADIKEMAQNTETQMRSSSIVTNLDAIQFVKKPIIAAVCGFALGGGCEVAMMCDIVIAGENAKFGQPEIKIGTIPGAGGTQRLPRAIGKSRAMELILTGDFIDAKEAERKGLVSKVLPVDQVLPESIKLAEKIASQSLPMIELCKKAVNLSFEEGLTSSHVKERDLFYGTWSYTDRKEGMQAFSQKRKPNWSNS
eukprot:TRINITY_DN9_c0_g2_i2.p1 TRINITY_DN9_c0_g2~~TRINITY_DN9_c0_g2_i2.p1  ORF type:complete len:302 (-),score=72.53 TRINITY_DN9_c0_g2_i2:39-944(-)